MVLTVVGVALDPARLCIQTINLASVPFQTINLAFVAMETPTFDFRMDGGLIHEVVVNEYKQPGYLIY